MGNLLKGVKLEERDIKSFLSEIKNAETRIKKEEACPFPELRNQEIINKAKSYIDYATEILKNGCF